MTEAELTLPLRARQIAGPAFLATLFMVLAAVSWRKWPDFLIDFGRELYMPWQLASGRLLYTDIASLFGPLSQHWNALLFKIFGVSLTTLTFSNLLILTVLVCLLYDFFAKACDRLTATLACTAFLVLFAFAHPIRHGNYNFVSPYSHEATHGVVLSVAMLWCLARYVRRRSLYLCGLAGAFLGLVFLTKPEVFVAAASAATLAFAVLYLSKPITGLSVHGALLRLTAGFAIPIAVCLAYFSFRMPFVRALEATAGAWMNIVATRPLASPFYLSVSGLDHPLGQAWDLLKMFTWLALSISTGVLLDWILRRHGRYPVLAGSIAGFIVIFTLAATISPSFWGDLGLPLPLLSALIGGWLIGRFLRQRHDLRSVERRFPLLIWSAFAFVLLGKTILNTRLYHYGFFLAFPASLLCISALVYFAPLVLSSRWGGGAVFRAFALTVVLFVLGVYFGQSLSRYRAKTAVAGSGQDVLFIHDPDLEPASFAILRALERIEALMPPDATLVVLPEGVMFNYLARRGNPTPYISFTPPELAAFGEDRMLAALREQPPDFIMVVHRNSRSDYGVGPFGVDPRYGQRIMDWVWANYRRVETILNEPLRDDRFGIAILAYPPSPISGAAPGGSSPAPVD